LAEKQTRLKLKMQVLDCRNLRELLDSYLSDELSVETNHAVLRHLEHCPTCRAELAARRNLREALRRAGTKLRMSEEGKARLREMLRQHGALPEPEPLVAESFFSRLRNFLPRQIFSAPLLAAMMLLVTLGLGGLLLFRPSVTSAAELSAALWQEAIGDHSYCAAQFAHEAGPVSMIERAQEYDPAYAALDRIAEVGAAGLKLRAAHICGFAGRNFAHLVYTRDGELISLLVTERNARAMKSGAVPDDDGLKVGLQQAIHNDLKVSAYQTRRYIVLIVSRLAEKENQKLAEMLALPVSRHLRSVEVKTK
jgi:anti-sigma factor RsiW